MKVLVACEESQAVTIAFRNLGHEAYSCDIQACSGGHPEWHIQGDVIPVLKEGWDLMIAHPPCTHLSVSGARWFTSGHKSTSLRNDALDFVRTLMGANIEKICIENPVSVISSQIRKSDQTIQPFWFGDPARKTTCLWLKNLPKLIPTNMVEPIMVKSSTGREWSQWFRETSLIQDRQARSKARSKTFPGIARAMAEQWGGDIR